MQVAEWKWFQNPSNNPCSLTNECRFWLLESFFLWLFEGEEGISRWQCTVSRSLRKYIESASVLEILNLDEHPYRRSLYFKKLDSRLLNICLMCMCLYVGVYMRAYILIIPPNIHSPYSIPTCLWSYSYFGVLSREFCCCCYWVFFITSLGFIGSSWMYSVIWVYKYFYTYFLSFILT